jgi:hypothetical protein
MLPLAILAVTGTLALLGAWLAADVIRRGQIGNVGTSQRIPTSFGVMTVENITQVKGMTSEELGGMTHNIQGFVSAKQFQLRALVTLTNLQGHAVTYSPTMFTVRAGTGAAPIAAVASSATSGLLAPGASETENLNFIVPQDGAELWLEFRDPGLDQPIQVYLGKADQFIEDPRNPVDSHHN